MSTSIVDIHSLLDTSQKSNIVYYTTPDGSVMYNICAKTAVAQSANPEYETTKPLTLTVGASASSSPIRGPPLVSRIAVADYPLPPDLQKNIWGETRVLYLDQQGTINEACWSQTGPGAGTGWFAGTISALQLVPEPGTALSVTVGPNFITLYYQKKATNQLYTVSTPFATASKKSPWKENVFVVQNTSGK